MIISKERFVQLHDRSNYGLSAGELVTYLRLLAEADGNNTVSLSYVKIGKEREIGWMAVKNHITKLKDVGLIRLVGKTERGANIYELT